MNKIKQLLKDLMEAINNLLNGGSKQIAYANS